MRVAGGLLERVAARSGHPVRYGTGVAIAVGEHQHYAAVHRHEMYAGTDEVGGWLRGIDRASADVVFYRYRDGKALDLAREMAEVPAGRDRTAPCRVDGVLFDAQLLARVLRTVNGTVTIRVPVAGTPRRETRPLIIRRAGADVLVLPMRADQDGDAKAPAPWGR